MKDVPAEAIPQSMLSRVFTKAELHRYNGRDGAPAYVACRGLVYDVSGSYHWRTGRHQVQHRAGADLTAELSDAPHGIELLARFPIVGVLRDE